MADDVIFTTDDARAVAEAHTKCVLLALAERFDAKSKQFRDDDTAYSYEAGCRRTWRRAAEWLRSAVADDLDLRRLADG